MKKSINDISKILLDNFISCDPEECWNGCGDDDEYGYIDVAIVFKVNDQTQSVFGDLLDAYDEDESWIWACFKGKNRCNKYFLTNTDTGIRINNRTNLAKAINKLFGKQIIASRQEFIKDLEKENK